MNRGLWKVSWLVEALQLLTLASGSRPLAHRFEVVRLENTDVLNNANSLERYFDIYSFLAFETEAQISRSGSSSPISPRKSIISL